jgi:hypothetical protein
VFGGEAMTPHKLLWEKYCCCTCMLYPSFSALLAGAGVRAMRPTRCAARVTRAIVDLSVYVSFVPFKEPLFILSLSPTLDQSHSKVLRVSSYVN